MTSHDKIYTAGPELICIKARRYTCYTEWELWWWQITLFKSFNEFKSFLWEIGFTLFSRHFLCHRVGHYLTDGRSNLIKMSIILP